MTTFIKLPNGEADAGFYDDDLVRHMKANAMAYIVQGQSHEALRKHPKPTSLDAWIRANHTQRKDTAQATDKVVDALVATKRFQRGQFKCPDTGEMCTGIELRETKAETVAEVAEKMAPKPAPAKKVASKAAKKSKPAKKKAAGSKKK